MKFLKRSAHQRPRLSLVLLDWSVRESFHVLDYLSRQTVHRDLFEIIVVEFYDRRSPALDPFADQVDTWLLLQMPASAYYHKHLMYNAGIVVARGEIVLFGDSDAMVRETFVETILRAFDKKPDLVFHIDQFRNLRRDLYPFRYPSFEEVMGEGCVNAAGAKTSGVVDTEDPLHRRNYGACMCARRDDLIAIGGADEHMDYLGHICGPYEMTFRLVSMGKREVWSEEEFTYHTWHPGQAGEDNYMGPHDGRHMSTTALRALLCGRVKPLVENPAIRALRTGSGGDPEAQLIRRDAIEMWDRSRLRSVGILYPSDTHACVLRHHGATVELDGTTLTVTHEDGTSAGPFDSLTDAMVAVERRLSRSLRFRLKLLGPAGALLHIGLALCRLGRRPLSTLLRWRRQRRNLGDRIARGVMEQRLFSTGLANLVTLLVRRHRSGRHRHAPMLVVSSQADRLLVRLMVLMRLLPPAHVAVAEDRRALERLLEDDARMPLLLHEDVYLRFHAMLAHTDRSRYVLP